MQRIIIFRRLNHLKRLISFSTARMQKEQTEIMDSLQINIADKLNKKLAKDKINSCIVYLNGQLVYEYFRNKKMKQKVHKVNSVTKSILSILIGIAIDQKKIKHVDQPISEYFSGLDECKKGITIRHLLTMSPGAAGLCR